MKSPTTVFSIILFIFFLLFLYISGCDSYAQHLPMALVEVFNATHDYIYCWIIFDFRATFGKHHFCHLHVFSCKLFIMIWRTSIYAEHRMTLIAYVSSPFNVAGGRKPWNPNRQLKMLFRLLRWFSVGIATWRWNRIHSTAAQQRTSK